MKKIRILSLTLLMVLYGMPVTTRAQGANQIFSLPEGSVGKIYRASIEAVLRDNYGMRLQSEAQASVFRWTFAGGEIPPGLVLRPNGTILGSPRVPRETPYQFKLKVTDTTTPMSIGLLLEFNLTVNASRVKLVPASTVKLVPEGESGSRFERIEWPQKGTVNQARPLLQLPAFQPLVKDAKYGISFEDSSSASFEKSTPVSDGAYDATDALTPQGYLATTTPSAQAANCILSCGPTPPPDDQKDYIIDAVSGATRGRTKFNKNERTRIIILNKNPFLYDYRVTIEEHPVEEPALAAFLDLLPIGKGTFDPKPTGTGPITISTACPEFVVQTEKNLAAQEDQLQQALGTLTDSSNSTQTEYDRVKDILMNPGSQCPQLCAEATGLRTTLNNYLTVSEKPLNDFAKAVKSFEDNSHVLSVAASQNTDCKTFEKLADHYLKVAAELQAKLKELQGRRKVFADKVKEINVVLSTPNAFFEVSERGDFDGPTDVTVKVERKVKGQTGAEFAQLVNTKINFGGRARFALAGGLVASLLERPEYQRVPGIVNGQVTNIVGLKRTSSTTILPLLMLHGRIYSKPTWNYVSGIHLSLGLTAKPNSEGTSAEFLFGPSISFLEERMFLTIGGYAGKKQELEGNLVLGSQIPTDFGDELPVSEHYVWKPGFAITYKIK
jgi:hypothetical protein